MATPQTASAVLIAEREELTPAKEHKASPSTKPHEDKEEAASTPAKEIAEVQPIEETRLTKDDDATK
jgi:hypothetical protein